MAQRILTKNALVRYIRPGIVPSMSSSTVTISQTRSSISRHLRYLHSSPKGETTMPSSFKVASCSHNTNRWFSSNNDNNNSNNNNNGENSVVIGADPVLDMQVLQESIMDLAPAMARGLSTEGYFTIAGGAILPPDMISLLRKQSIELRRQGRFEQSWSEKIVNGVSKQRFDKEGVFACEPDGQDFDFAPDLIVYMSVMLKTLPGALNQSFVMNPPPQGSIPHPELSNTSFNAKLAVTLPGGSTYPLHIDNPQGLEADDTRKLTCILYLNPDYQVDRGDGGELRIILQEGENGGASKQVDLTPEGGRLVLFWSDEIPHEVLPTAPDFVGATEANINEGIDNPLDRYALTLWIPTEDATTIHNESSLFRSLRDMAFP